MEGAWRELECGLAKWPDVLLAAFSCYGPIRSSNSNGITLNFGVGVSFANVPLYTMQDSEGLVSTAYVLPLQVL